MAPMDISVQRLKIDEEYFFQINDVDQMRPFFMSLVSDSNHWMFISSNGGLTAGRKNSEFALFPYYTDDKITESSEITGSKSIFRIQKEGVTHIWEPFSERYEGIHKTTQNLYKNLYGNKIIFEEVNHDLGLTFQYQWSSSNLYGFVRKAKLINHGIKRVDISMVDGMQNVLPNGVGSDLQNAASNLVDAYKRNQLDTKSGLGIFALSAIIVDKAEPSESLKANVVWSLGFENPKRLLSSLQLKNFRKGLQIEEEVEVKAEKGAYFLHDHFSLDGNETKRWMMVANVNQNHADVTGLIKTINEEKSLSDIVETDVERGTQNLIKLNGSSDGIQLTGDKLRDARHFSNTLFNIMRGGIFDENYQIEKQDFSGYLKHANVNVLERNKIVLGNLSDSFSWHELKAIAETTNDDDFIRLCIEYLPLKFSRRHGDPSRPWNKFSINTKSEIDGSKILDYEGNWRDIFQNWEALALSYPQFIEGMLFKFLNATTFDGYNPYRVTKGGFDWERIEKDDPWSYIGYWGDHQIIYLLKFLEFFEKSQPGKLGDYFDREIFVYANVPYRIKGYEDLLGNSKDTIDFDHALDAKLIIRQNELGADGALWVNGNNQLIKANLIEKLLATVLAKVSNFIPEAGIWMNTQRPEWNDANNALVGNGVSMVTLNYLRRFLSFFESILKESKLDSVNISTELYSFFNAVQELLDEKYDLLKGKISDVERKAILDGLGIPASLFRTAIYNNGFSGKKTSVSIENITYFTSLMLDFAEHSIRANRRKDGLYHAYNLMSVEDNGVSIDYLDEMLEGQVAVLSSGCLDAVETLQLLDALKSSALFREDQYSYLLYPNKRRPRFLEKNIIPSELVKQSKLLSTLLKRNNKQIIEQDVNGDYHFNGAFNNADHLKKGLTELGEEIDPQLIQEEQALILSFYEKVFNHKAFTGRSGTFYGYEGLGSIYWHMVSKLQLAVQECCIEAITQNESAVVIGKLLEHYYEINEGIGVHKSPQLYGAFPTDPYSHTPQGKGAQQPGMTGQVKEDILSRFGELGLVINNGKINFQPTLLRKTEFLIKDRVFDYVDLTGKRQSIAAKKGSLCFTFCQVPIIYHLGEKNSVSILRKNGDSASSGDLVLSSETSKQIFERRGEIEKIEVTITEEACR